MSPTFQLENFWYIGCATAQLSGQPFSTEICGEKIVLFRDSSGKPQALRDRCCHRGMPLSKGKIKGDIIACGFHGWEFNGDGKCTKIPSQPEQKAIAKVYCVPAYTCQEQDGYVWVWIGTDSKRTDSPPPISEFNSSNWMQGSSIVKCHYLRALEITFDGAHVYFVHPTHPATVAAAKTGMSDLRGEVRITDNGCIAFSPATENERDPIPSVPTMEFSLPGRIRFVAPTPSATYYMYFHITPSADQSCRIDWLITNTTHSDTHVTWVPHSDFLNEDVIVLEAIQTAYESEGEAFEKSVEADAAPLLLRKIVKLAADGKWMGKATDLPPRQTFSQRGPKSYSV